MKGFFLGKAISFFEPPAKREVLGDKKAITNCDRFFIILLLVFQPWLRVQHYVLEAPALAALALIEV